MSTFGIFIETIGVVRPHPNADRLELAELTGIGYQFVIGKGLFAVGDPVLYFPVDAILPESLIATLGLTGKLAGKQKNRVKTVKLRGEISQGLVGPTSLLGDGNWAASVPGTDDKFDYAPVLGVSRYEPEEAHSGGPNAARQNFSPLPAGVSKYDLENCERWRVVVDELMDQPVVVTEKLEGSHIAVTVMPDGSVTTCSRNCTIAEPASHYVIGAQNSGVYALLASLHIGHPGQQATVRGELLGPGIQGNIYGLKKLEVYIFDIEIDGRPVGFETFLSLISQGRAHFSDLKLAPLLNGFPKSLRETLGLAGCTDVRAYSNGKSCLADCLREGVVIKPWVEQTHPRLGRLILKQRSPEYLAAEAA